MDENIFRNFKFLDKAQQKAAGNFYKKLFL